METRKIAELEVTLVGLGCNNFGMRCDEEQTGRVVHQALDEGINFFDTADVYSKGKSEEFLGKALGRRRDEVLIATKFANPMGEGTGGGSAGWVKQACEDSLKRLGTDRIDLYQMHIPAGDVPIEETLRALDDLVTEGKVRFIGCSNFSAEQIDEARKVSANASLVPFVSAQDHWSLLQRDVEQEVIGACERHDMRQLPYFPLASGLLTGKYRKGQPLPEDTRLSSIPEERRERWMSEDKLDTVEELISFCEERDRTILELAFSWLASQDVVASVIAGATKPEQVSSNTNAIGWRLSEEELEKVDEITRR